MSELWRYVSPRLSLSYRLKPSLSLKAGAGIFYQLPSYTSLGFKSDKGVLLNKQLSYIRVKSGNVGIEYNKEERLILSVEGFYKYYDKAPLSVSDQIPLACKGNDYGIVGDELLIPSASGKAYGVEASLRWQIPSKFNMVSSLTLYKSEYRNTAAGAYISSAWDNRFIVNVFGTYNLSRNWSIGAKLSAIGGAPYTPYDVDKSSLVEAWNVKGRPYFDYAQYNQRRLKTYAQLDVLY
jgi:outer membrane receptor for ferrienterochelin and colicin